MTDQQRISWILFGLLVFSIISHYFTQRELQYVCSFVPFEEDELPADKTKRAERDKVARICNPSPSTSE